MHAGEAIAWHFWPHATGGRRSASGEISGGVGGWPAWRVSRLVVAHHRHNASLRFQHSTAEPLMSGILAAHRAFPLLRSCFAPRASILSMNQSVLPLVGREEGEEGRKRGGDAIKSTKGFVEKRRCNFRPNVTKPPDTARIPYSCLNIIFLSYR